MICIFANYLQLGLVSNKAMLIFAVILLFPVALLISIQLIIDRSKLTTELLEIQVTIQVWL